jgi:hypothetical protein
MPRFTILFLLIITAVIAYIFSGYSARLHEANRIERANRQYNSQIFRRCDGIAELRQFVELYNPELANESFDDGKVVSVICIATIDDRYTANAHADVQINEEGTYELIGEIKIRIVDSVGKFTRINGTSTSIGQSVDLNSTEWTDFVDGGANIDSIRTINQNAITQYSE